MHRHPPTSTLFPTPPPSRSPRVGQGSPGLVSSRATVSCAEIYFDPAASPTRAANLSQKLSVSFWAVPFNRRAPTLATVPRTSELALHFRRDRLGGMSSISSMVLTSTPEPGALPWADILRLVGGFTSDSSTSS